LQEHGVELLWFKLKDLLMSPSDELRHEALTFFEAVIRGQYLQLVISFSYHCSNILFDIATFPKYLISEIEDVCFIHSFLAIIEQIVKRVHFGLCFRYIWPLGPHSVLYNRSPFTI
jgi:hypothetical protein